MRYMTRQLYPYVKLTQRLYPRITPLSKLRRLLWRECDEARNSRWSTARILYRFTLYKLGVRSAGLVWLPVLGESAIRVRHGYKVFDTQRGLTTKVFGESTRQSVKENEVRLHREISGLAYAPALREVGENYNWYSEELLLGNSGHDFAPAEQAAFVDTYHANIEPLLLSLIRQQSLKKRPIASYLEALDNAIATPLSSLRESHPEVSSKAQKLLQISRHELQAAQTACIYITFAHGDFHMYNIIGEPGKAKLIDWDCKDNLSLLYDLYTYHFSNMWVGITQNAKEIGFDFAIRSLSEHLQTDMPEVAQDLMKNARLYRLVYYRERIKTFLTRLNSKPKSMRSWLDLYLETERLDT